MSRLLVVSVFSAALAIVAPCALAWGPTTQEAVVTTALHVLNKEGVVQIARLAREVREGASATAEAIQKVHPAYSEGAIRAIEAEIRLLSTVRANSVDPYFAYRLGMLGAMISQVSAPLAGEPSAYRTQYYQDVDRNLQQVPLKASLRKNVEVVPYLDRVRVLASQRRDLLLKDYQAGIGFSGVARTSLAEEASRSIEAVADLWFTVLTGPTYQSGVSEEQIQGYIVRAMQFYVQRGSVAEVDSNYARLVMLASKTPALARQLGDIFYDGRFYDRAIKEYDLVLQHEPGQREILEKIAAYYIMVGNELTKAKKLEQAYEAYARAAKADPLHSNAEAKRLEMEAEIKARDARQETARRQIQEAKELETQAEQAAMRSRHAEAIKALHDAEDKYRMVSSEFLPESQAAADGLTHITVTLRELTNSLIQNAQTLSGSGTVLDVQKLADASTKAIDEGALRAINAKLLDEELERLKEEMRPSIEYR